METTGKKYERGALEALVHGEGAAISASLLLGVKHYTEYLPYREWSHSFDAGLRAMQVEDQHAAHGFQMVFAEISEKYSGTKADITTSPEYRNLINQVRGEGVPRRWDYERYLGQHAESAKHSGVFGGYQSDGHVHAWTDADWQQIQHGNRVAVGEGGSLGKHTIFEGHHGDAIHSMVSGHYDDMGKMYDPDNIRLGTPKWHLEQGHHGSWQNQVGGRFTDISDHGHDAKVSTRDFYDNQSHAEEAVAMALGVAWVLTAA